jgi:Tfp pilus assembly protein PilE
MPKIPTFESRSRPTAEVASIKSNIQLSPTASTAAALSKVASSMEDYYIKQRDNVEKLEAKKKYLELKGKSDLIIEKNKNNADEFGAISSYTEEFNSLKTQELSKVQNRRVKKKLERIFSFRRS